MLAVRRSIRHAAPAGQSFSTRGAAQTHLQKYCDVTIMLGSALIKSACCKAAFTPPKRSAGGWLVPGGS